MTVQLESTEQVDKYTLFRFTGLDAESVSAALGRTSSISGRSILAKRRLSISVIDVKKAIKAMKRKSDPVINQMARLMETAKR